MIKQLIFQQMHHHNLYVAWQTD